jgi:steroid delta-isomerase-like uncharacterized protein
MSQKRRRLDATAGRQRPTEITTTNVGEDIMEKAMTIAERLRIAREYIDVVFNQHSPERAVEFVSPDVIWHGNTLGVVAGAENVANLLTAFIGALPDLYASEEDAIANDDLVVLRLVVTATQSGDLLGIPATNREVRWDAVDIYRIDDSGRITEEWAFDDLASVAAQLGAATLPLAS